MKFADVIVPLAVDGMFTYELPASLQQMVGVGSLVIVPFVGNKKYTAIVCRLHNNTPEGFEVKPIDSLAEDKVTFSDLHLRFLFWVSEYYMATPGEVMKAALPVAFRLESFTTVTREQVEIDYSILSEREKILLAFLRPGEYVALKEIEKYLKIKNGLPLVRSLLNKNYIRIKETVDEFFREKKERYVVWGGDFREEQLNEILDSLKRAHAQHKMLCRWIESGKKELEKSDFANEIGNSIGALRGLCDRGILKIEERSVSRSSDGNNINGGGNLLTAPQQKALDEIRSAYKNKECVLLQGVTSSGKTELYVHLIKEYIAKGKQVLYMLPEIALTIQIVRRLQKVFGDSIGIYHSGMSDSIKAEMWRKQCSEEPYRVVLGVRSSIFLPFRKLGLIIVDEEHDASYKQKEPAPRYNGRDAAIMLANMVRAKILLGSATPSFESFYNVRNDKYGYAALTTRYGDVQMPEILFSDLSEYRRKKLMKGNFSPLLINEIQQVLDEGKQVILFQNRRGYSSYVQCDKCGTIPKCKHCDVSLTYYKQRNVLSCRYCGSLHKIEEVCTSCNLGHYKERIPGTEKIEEEIMRFFPDRKVARMDLDVMTSKARFRAVIDDFEQGKTDILIGTQMVTKGLDFENVKLVGVMDADSMVNFPDFRAEERAYCMLMQVSGRSGRRGERGKVIIQAGDVKNRVYTMLQQGDYTSFFTQLSGERKFFSYPPFTRLILIEMRGKDLIVLRNSANHLAFRLREVLGKRVFGPATPDVGRISGQYRLQFILKVEHGASLVSIKNTLKKEFADFYALKKYAGIRIFCDVDPM